MKKSNGNIGTVAASSHQGRRRAGGRHRRTVASEHPLGLCRLSGPPGQDRGGQYAGRAVRHHRAHRHGRAAAKHRQDLHRGKPRRRRRQYRLRLCRQGRPGRLHDPADHQFLLGQRHALSPAALQSERLRPGVRTGEFAQHVHGKSRLAGEDDEGIRRARPRQPGQIQLRDAADRHVVANAAGVPESDRKTAETGRRRVQGRRRRHHRAARRQRATELRLARAGVAAHQGRHAALPRRHRRPALARIARCADHGAGRLQGLRVRGRLRAAGAGQDAARSGQVAGGGNAQGSPRPRGSRKSCTRPASWCARKAPRPAGSA